MNDDPIDVEVVEGESEGVTGSSTRPDHRKPDESATPTAAGLPATRTIGPEAIVRALELTGSDAVLRAVDAIRGELSDRDNELRAVLARLGELYGHLRDATERHAGAAHGTSGNRPTRALLTSVDALTAVTEASVDRSADLTRSVERLAESVHHVAERLDRLTRRVDDTELMARRSVHLTEQTAENLAALARRLSAPTGRTRLRAVGDNPNRH